MKERVVSVYLPLRALRHLRALRALFPALPSDQIVARAIDFYFEEHERRGLITDSPHDTPPTVYSKEEIDRILGLL